MCLRPGTSPGRCRGWKEGQLTGGCGLALPLPHQSESSLCCQDGTLFRTRSNLWTRPSPTDARPRATASCLQTWLGLCWTGRTGSGRGDLRRCWDICADLDGLFLKLPGCTLGKPQLGVGVPARRPPSAVAAGPALRSEGVGRRGSLTPTPRASARCLPLCIGARLGAEPRAFRLGGHHILLPLHPEWPWVPGL